MKVENLRSPRGRTRGLVYFGRMLDKIRLHAAGRLPAEYHDNLGGGFDEFCCKFLGIDYAALVDRTKAGGTDEEILDWCFAHGQPHDAHEISIWNAFMTKRGWNDEAAERLAMRKREAGWSRRDDIQTFFDFIDADEGRPVTAPGSELI